VGTHPTLPVIDVAIVNEGGSIKLDGVRSLPTIEIQAGRKRRYAEAYFRFYLGVTNFIWLNGVKGQDITDDHIDGTVRFVHSGSTI